MDRALKTGFWQQFGAAIDTLDNAIHACPDDLWHAGLWDRPSEPPGYAQFWYIAYHALFWLDFYLSDSIEGFAPPAPFTLSEFDPVGFPNRVYTRDELLTYREYGRHKCRVRIETLEDEQALQSCRPLWPEMSIAELLLNNMRHVQEHAAQLNLFLGQNGIPAPGWVSRVDRRVR